MRTEDLIASLSSGLQPIDTRRMSRLLGWGCVVGGCLSLLMLLLVFGLREDLGTALQSWPFWMKWTYTLCVALTAYLLYDRLARPAGRTGWLALLPVLPVALLAVIAIRTQWQLPALLRTSTWLGHSAQECPFNIAALSIPAFAVLCLMLRRAAPTRLRAAAAAAGLLSGAMAAFAYGLFCTESSVAFVAAWYTLGMLLPALMGLALGPLVLRWR